MRRAGRRGLAVLSLLLASCGGGGGGGSASAPPAPVQSFTDPTLYSSAASASLASASEITSVTHAQLALNGASLAYTSTTGHLTALDPVKGLSEASFFYVAYTLDGASPAARPVTFFYNGGPGSASVWLHLGSFGPKRLSIPNFPATTATTPFALVDNGESLLDVSDLVFVDAVGTGLSEAIAPNTNRNFWSVDTDAAVFRDFIQRYVSVNNRNASPRFLFGESYGTTRTAVLANLLETAGVPLAGIVLQSSILDYGSNCGVTVATTIHCTGYVPSYAATAAWFNLATPNPAPADLPDFIQRARLLADPRYDAAVGAFLTAKTPPTASLLGDLNSFTGLSIAQWQSDFNLTPDYFQQNLVPRTLLGIYDARVTAPTGSALASQGDPSSTFINDSFAVNLQTYLAGPLAYTNPSNYVMAGNAINSWDFGHAGIPLPDVVPDLLAALALNPRLKVLSLNGYNDLVTPFFQTERDLQRLGTATNISVRFYSSGHMTYLDDNARREEKADLAQFYRSATAP